jgi:rare lipoprotein A
VPDTPTDSTKSARNLRSAICNLQSLLAVVSILVGMGCAHRGPEPAETPSKGWRERGDASWYGEPYHGRRTASGEVYDMYELTAAHRTLDFGTRVRVTRRDDGRVVEVRINDRGPFIAGRIIDLSYAAARRIGLDVDGVTAVVVEVVGRSEPPPRPPDAAEPKDCWWVQIGAFGDAANADRARDRLRDAGHPALVMEGPDGLQRVRVGPFDDDKAARRALNELIGLYPPAKVIACGG